jgi:hypothetical protein
MYFEIKTCENQWSGKYVGKKEGEKRGLGLSILKILSILF